MDFHQWTLKHGVSFKSEFEKLKRQSIFIENIRRIEEHNAGDHSYEMEINEFAAMDDEEFYAQYLLPTPQNCSATQSKKHDLQSSNMPKSRDWRTSGIVSPIKNQKRCGSCWAFSTIAAMEAHMVLKYGGSYNLSEQQLVDCAWDFNNFGCNGGLPSQAFEYIRYNPGIMKNKDYPYTAKDGKCVFDKCRAEAFVDDVVNITAYDEVMLQEAVGNIGPVSVAYEVAPDFRFYKSGVYTSNVCRTDPEHVSHAVLAVGYNIPETGLPYWIIKNSWGSKWGMGGYFHMELGKNMCGITVCASYPVVINYSRLNDRQEC